MKQHTSYDDSKIPFVLISQLHRYLKIAIILLGLQLTRANCLAGIAPVFGLDSSCWYATDIVVVDEGENIDGKLSVIETWRGPLVPGDKLSIPELAQYASPSRRKINVQYTQANHPRTPAKVSGRRMILFLRPAFDERTLSEETHFQRPKPRRSRIQPRKWFPASRKNYGIHVSTIWIENEMPFVFTQPRRPGPLELTRPREILNSESAIKKKVNLTNNYLDLLNHAEQESNITRKLKLLTQIIQDPYGYAKEEALHMMVKCGPEAMEHLNSFYKSTQNVVSDRLILKTMKQIIIQSFDRKTHMDSWTSFVQWLNEELEYWEENVPSLPLGWWQGETLSEIRMNSNKDGPN